MLHSHQGKPHHSSSGLRPTDRKAVAFTAKLLEELSLHPSVQVLDSFDSSKRKIWCPNEDGKLLSAVMSPPTHLDWEGLGINKNEQKFKDNKPDRLLATQQHAGLMKILLGHGVKLDIIKPDKKRLDGVYTRDVAFAIDGKLYLSNFKREQRLAEEAVIAGGTKPDSRKIIIEGGNVILGKDMVFLGIGDRTTPEAVEWLQFQLGTSREVVPLKLKDHILHLDCALLPIEKNGGSKSAAFVYPYAFENPKELSRIWERYGQVEILSQREYGQLGPNILKLDKFKVIVNHASKRIRKKLEELGIEAIPYDYGEIIKGGGSYRCTFMPYQREN